MTKLDYLFKQFESILGWYTQSEEKAKFLVGLNTLVVGVVNGLVFVGADKMRAAREVYSLPLWLLLGLSGVALVTSYLFILRAMWPRHQARDSSLKPAENIWFFGDLQAMSSEEHRAAMAEWSEEAVEKTMLRQNHILSKNVWIKHNALNWAIAFTIVALVFVLALGVAYGFAVVNSPMQPTARVR